MTHVLIRASQSFVTGRGPSVLGVSSAADGSLRGTPSRGGPIGAAERGPLTASCKQTAS